MLLSIIFTLAGLALILVGANCLTDGASDLARRMGVSDLIVGLTVVAFGTSAPELAISVISALNGSSELAVGNVVGSNIFNTLFIIGVTAMVTPMVIRKSILTKDIPLVVLSSVALLVMGNGQLLDGASTASITRSDGLLLLLFFAIFMRYTFAQATSMPAKEAASDISAVNVAEKATSMPLWRALVYVAGGLGALIWGGNLFVDGASAIASAMGVSEAVIGLTVVAAGTSLPELAASLAAAVKGRTEMALGNVIGSNIFNIFLVLGCAATVEPLSLGTIGNFDLLSLVAASVLFWTFGCFFASRTINRTEGAVLAACYVAYTAVLVVNAL